MVKKERAEENKKRDVRNKLQHQSRSILSNPSQPPQASWLFHEIFRNCSPHEKQAKKTLKLCTFLCALPQYR